MFQINWGPENWKNKLFFGDNLEIMQKYIPDEIIDLVYLDPPFNSKKDYNVIFKEPDNPRGAPAQIKAFEDTWHWTIESEETLQKIAEHSLTKPQLIDLLNGFVKALGKNDATAYLVMLTIRLLEIYRIMRPTASIYLHCDPTMSHYIKVIMDQIFGIKNFGNEIIWCYAGGGIPKKDFPRKHDVILRYIKDKRSDYYFNPPLRPYSPGTLQRGRTKVKGKYYEKGLNPAGTPVNDWWTDIKPLHSPTDKEKLGYPTQKPVALLKRIIIASSKEGDLVFDPFCGCGTTIDAAQELNRRWVGIDITHLAITLIKHRLIDKYGSNIINTFEVHGEPVTVKAARELAHIDRINFQIWACGLIGAKPSEKRSSDKGIDGYLYFYDGKNLKKGLVQVKSGRVSVKDIRDFRGTIEREEAPLGIFITLEEPTSNMLQEAAVAGFYEDTFTGRRYPKIQILTIKELLNGKKPNVPLVHPYHKQAPKKKNEKEKTLPLWSDNNCNL